ncbi:MAG TPA: hypothetical protein VLU73_17045 [Methylococcaceae bacterium]|jgi:hypothetical protein|nr:hypothetical protein [Methylococcaceae bacterium]
MISEPSAQILELPYPETLVLTLRAQLLRYARDPSPAVAGNIANCLDKLLAHPQFKGPPEERCTYRQMRTYWRLVETLG